MHAQKLPKVNRQLAEKLLEESSKPGKSKRATPTSGDPTPTAPGKEAGDANPLRDPRFAAMFTNPDYEVEEGSEEYRRLHPLLSHRDKKRKEQQNTHPSQQEEVGVACGHGCVVDEGVWL